MFDPAAEMKLVGDFEAGQGLKVIQKVDTLIMSLNTGEFDLMDALHEIKSKKFYLPKFNTFGEFAKSLEKLKSSRAYYLVKIKEVMTAGGYERADYEPLGMLKLRIISRLDPNDVASIKAVMAVAAETTTEALKELVAGIQGLTGDDAMVWLNVSLKKAARDVIEKAMKVAKYQIGTVSKDDEGMSKDASDGSALERVALDFLSDPANVGPEDFVVEEANVDAI